MILTRVMKMAGNNKINGTAEKRNGKGKLIVITGFSGSGKGTVLKELFKLSDYKYSISATTRPPRIGEAHGVDYYFLSKEEFQKKIYNGELLEYVEYSGNFYGTLREPVIDMLEKGHNIILEIEVKGALDIKEKFPEALMIFITPPSYTELEKRLRNRGTESEKVIEKRLEISKWEINHISRYDYFIINEENRQKEAAEAINSIVNAGIDTECDVTKVKYRVDKERAQKFIEMYFA